MSPEIAQLLDGRDRSGVSSMRYLRGHPWSVAIATEEQATPEAEGKVRSLWVMDIPKFRVDHRFCWRRLLTSSSSADPKHNLLDLDKPALSLDEARVYVETSAWATSPAIHEVDLETGAERFVIDGGMLGVIRTGPYSGTLLVRRHKYHPAPQFGSYDPVDVVRPDGKVMLTVPGSETDEGEPSVARWLKAHGWSAN